MTQPDLIWSTERPTESGDYWLSVHPDKRGSEWDSVEYVRFTVCEDGSCFVQRVRHNAIFDRQTVTDALFNGAKWAKHSLPFDPFEDIHTTPPQHQTGTSFTLHLEHASALVQSWPEWKQQVLGSPATTPMPNDEHSPPTPTLRTRPQPAEEVEV